MAEEETNFDAIDFEATMDHIVEDDNDELAISKGYFDTKPLG